MKTLKDKFVSEHLWYMVLAYLHDTKFQIVYDNKWETYDEKTGMPQFTLGWLNHEQFKYVVQTAVKYFIDQSKDITEENIEKYAEE